MMTLNNLAGVLADSGVKNRISVNSIFSNGDRGIVLNLGNNANNKQPAPQLTSAVFNVSGTGIKVFGKAFGTANTNITVELFVIPAGDPTAMRLIAVKTVNTNGTASRSFTFDLTFDLTFSASPGDVFIATDTDALGNTSEFSNAVVLS